MTGHHIGGTVSDQDDVHTGLIHKGGHGIIIGGQHGNALAIGFHLRKHLGGDAFGLFVNRHNVSALNGMLSTFKFTSEDCERHPSESGSHNMSKSEVDSRCVGAFSAWDAVLERLLHGLHDEYVTML